MRYVLLTLILSIGCFLLIKQSTVYAAVVINEIYPKEEGNEWIELYNNGSDQVLLDRWSLENSKGEIKKFTFNASAKIEPKGFLTVTQSETGIVLNNEGDTLRLSDTSSQVDSQSYPSILGFNSSIGRSFDGGGSWTNCSETTKNLPNTCPAPTPTPTAPPTPIPTNTPLPTLTPSILPTSTALPLPTNVPASSPQVLATTDMPIPTPPLQELGQSDTLRTIGWIVFTLGIVWGIIILVATVHHMFKKK